MQQRTFDSTQTQARRWTMPAVLLRLEGLAVLISAVVAYWVGEGSWLLFAALFFAPDLVFVVWAIDKRAGTIAYNLAHSYVAPIALGAISLATGWPLGVNLALIWFAHIGMDRTIGYGLKYVGNFNDTHLGRV